MSMSMSTTTPSVQTDDAVPVPARTPALDHPTFYALTQLYADYAAALSAGEWDRWPGFFTDDGRYRLQPRENHERGLPLATLSFESRGMLEDRVYGIRETLFHDPYYQRLVIGVPRVRRVDPGRIECEANYALFRTKLSELTTVFSVGRSIDLVVPTDDGAERALRFASRLVIYDSEMIPNSIIYPL
jgi:salicylate 5-hydroxylase small subunit